MQIDRLFKIIYYLLNNRKTTAQALSDTLEVSKRTILRDIDVLSYAGIPIYTQQGTGGGIFLDRDFVFNKAILTNEEQNNILIALQTVAATGPMGTEQLRHKLSNLFSNSQSDFIEVDFSSWGAVQTNKITFQELLETITKSQTIVFTYTTNEAKENEYLVYPLKLQFKSKAWYLEGYVPKRKGFRVFKINRISDLKISSEIFDKKEMPQRPDLSENQPTENIISLKLRFSPDVFHRLCDDFDKKDIIKEPLGSYLLNIEVPETKWVYDFILSFGEAVEVIEPQHVRQKLCEKALLFLKKNSF